MNRINNKNIKYIKDIDVEEIEIYTKYSERQLYMLNEPDLGVFIAESAKIIDRALNAGHEPISAIIDCDYINDELVDVLNRIHEIKEIPIYTAPKEVVNDLVGFNLARGIICLMKRIERPSMEEICENKRRIVVLDDVENPTNVGSIFRSAAALGFEAILLGEGCSDPLYRRTARVSMGTVFQIPWTYVDSKYMDKLKSLGYRSCSMALKENSKNIDDGELKACEKLAVIMGNEGIGLSDKILDECDYTVMIPMYNGVDSLNVAAASAIAFYELAKK